MAQCPTCNGTGKIVCPSCQGSGEITTGAEETCVTCSGSGVVKPTITSKSSYSWLSDGKVFVQARFENEEDVEVFGRVTVEVEAPTANYTGTSSRTRFPPHEEIEVSVTIEGISYADYKELEKQMIFKKYISLSEVDDIVCPRCDGNKVVPVVIECQECGGTGFVDCPTCGGSVVDGGGQNENLNVPFDIGGAAFGVAVVAGVAIAAFVVVRKRKVREKDLRKLLSHEFQNWVLKRLAGKPSSLRDSRMGIDGYTIEGDPISIKQSDGIGRNVIDSFASAMGQSKAKNGIIVAFSFSDDAIRGKVRAKLNYRLEIKMVTVKELIESRKGTF